MSELADDDPTVLRAVEGGDDALLELLDLDERYVADVVRDLERSAGAVHVHHSHSIESLHEIMLPEGTR